MAVVDSKQPQVKKVKAKKKKKASRSPKRDYIEIGPQMMMDHAVNGRITPGSVQYREYQVTAQTVENDSRFKTGEQYA